MKKRRIALRIGFIRMRIKRTRSRGKKKKEKESEQAMLKKSSLKKMFQLACEAMQEKGRRKRRRRVESSNVSLNNENAAWHGFAL